MPEEFEDKVIFIRRTAKTYQGGRRFRFGAMVAIGDRNGRVGIGLGKAKEVPIAVQKGQYVARRNLIEVPIEEPGHDSSRGFRYTQHEPGNAQTCRSRNRRHRRECTARDYRTRRISQLCLPKNSVRATVPTSPTR